MLVVSLKMSLVKIKWHGILASGENDNLVVKRICH